jgi:hypothetical protein
LSKELARFERTTHKQRTDEQLPRAATTVTSPGLNNIIISIQLHKTSSSFLFVGKPIVWIGIIVFDTVTAQYEIIDSQSIERYSCQRGSNAAVGRIGVVSVCTLCISWVGETNASVIDRYSLMFLFVLPMTLVAKVLHFIF